MTNVLIQAPGYVYLAKCQLWSLIKWGWMDSLQVDDEVVCRSGGRSEENDDGDDPVEEQLVQLAMISREQSS